MSHADLIDGLGGTMVVARRCKVGASVVSNWRERGIPWRWRAEMAGWAEETGVPVPPGFLSPTQDSENNTAA